MATSSVCYVGVDLVTEQVVAVARDAEYIRDSYIIRGEFGEPGVIYLPDDGTFNGRRALAIATAQNEPIGLGWTFKPRFSAAWSA